MVRVLLAVLDLVRAAVQAREVEFLVKNVRAKLLWAANVRLVAIEAVGRFKIVDARPGPLGVGRSLEWIPGSSTAISRQGEGPPEILSRELANVIVAATTGAASLDLCLSGRAGILIVRVAALPVNNFDGASALASCFGGERLGVSLGVTAGCSVNLTDESTLLLL